MANWKDWNAYSKESKATTNEQGMNTKDWDERKMKLAFGGPIGWYEAATGKNVISSDATKMFGDTPAYAEMNDEDVFNSMDDGAWDEFNKLNQQERAQFVADRKKKIAPDLAARAEADAQKKKEADFQSWRMQTLQRLDAFSKEMGMPVEELIKRGDLGVQQAGDTGRTQAGAAAYGAGLGGGGLSSMNTQRAVTDAQSRYQMQRQQMGLQATDSLMNQMGSLAHEGEDTRRYEQGLNMSLQQANEQANQYRAAQAQAKQSQLFGMIGGGVGAMYGGPSGAAMGYSLGSGLGGYTAPQYQPRNLQYPTGSTKPGSGFGGLGSGSSGGKNPFGGSQ